MFNKCQCLQPGFCPVFSRTMGVDPPDWKWCQRTTPKERKKYHNILSRAAPPQKQPFIEYLVNYNYDKEWFHLFYLAETDTHHLCKKAKEYQATKKRKRIVSLIENQKENNHDFSNIEILCLGHHQDQFKTIQDRPYLKKINLNEIDAGEYSDNKWAEARVFLSKEDLFRKETEFVGLVTASWNMKYKPFSLIDNFHNWNTSKLLLNSKSEDKIFLCADIHCCCSWVNHASNGVGSILDGLLFCNKADKKSGKFLLKLLGLNDYRHVKVPFANQMITHKSVFLEYQSFLKDNNIPDKIDWFVKNHILKQSKISDKNNVLIKYHNNRIHAYLMEMTSCFWLAKKDYTYIPNAERREEWYNKEEIKDRIKQWY